MRENLNRNHSRPPKRTSEDSNDLTNQVLYLVNEHFFECPQENHQDDSFNIFGKNLAMKLRYLPQQQRLLAEKIKNDTIFEEEMGFLKKTIKNPRDTGESILRSPNIIVS